MLPREALPVGWGEVLPVATGRLHGNIFIERLLLLPCSVYADGAGRANGRVVAKDFFCFRDGELVERNVLGDCRALPKQNKKMPTWAVWGPFIHRLTNYLCS